MNSRLNVLMVLVVVALWSTGLAARLIPIEEAIEGIAYIQYSKSTRSGSLSIRACRGCALKTWPIGPETAAFAAGRPVGTEALVDRHRKFVTVIYNIKTGRLASVVW